MNRKDIERKRNRAIKRLKQLGMSDVEIAKELGEPIGNVGSADEKSSIPVDSDGIIDAEIVEEHEPSDSGAMRKPSAHLPAVILQPANRNQKSPSNPEGPQRYSKKSDEWWEQRSPEVQARRCKAHRKDGGQCRQVAIAGATVCRWHGGAAKHVKAAARARLENASDLMAKQLLRMAIDDDVADAVKLSAIKDALDRAGLRAPNEVVLSPGQQSGFDDVFTDIVAGPPIDVESTGSVDSQANSSPYFDEPPPAPVDADLYADHPHWPSNSDRPAAPQTDVPRERRQSQRGNGANRYTDLSDDDAIRLANEENAALAERYGLPWGRSG